jgi:transcription antitermination factor NusG
MVPTPSVDQNAWFAAQVWAGREHISAKHLRMRGYDVFFPTYQERRYWSDRVKTITRALFTGYLFCRLEGTSVAKIVTTPGVIRLVGDRTRPLPVATAEITAVRRIVDAGVTAEPWEFIHEGQRVRIAGGPLRDAEGIIVRTKNRHRLVVSVSVLQRSVAVEIDARWVTVPPSALVGLTLPPSLGESDPTGV